MRLNVSRAKTNGGNECPRFACLNETSPEKQTLNSLTIDISFPRPFFHQNRMARRNAKKNTSQNPIEFLHLNLPQWSPPRHPSADPIFMFLGAEYVIFNVVS